MSNSTQLNSTQLNSTQLNSTQLNSTQLNSTQLNDNSTLLTDCPEHQTTLRWWRILKTDSLLQDGSVNLKFKTTSKQEVLRFILGQGHTVKVLAPPELVEEINNFAPYHIR